VAIFDGGSGALQTTFHDDHEDSDFGETLLGLGDIDGDGKAEVAISAAGSGGRGGGTGRVLVLSSRTGKSLYELRGERAHERFGANMCLLADWRGGHQAAIAVSARAGGPTGRGYVRVFDLATGSPLQTFASTTNISRFGVAMIDLGDRNHDGLRELGVLSLVRDGHAVMWSLNFADSFAKPSQTYRVPSVLPK
jgi:hypothetical protein